MVVLGTPFWMTRAMSSIGAAVDPAIVGQVGAFAAAAGPAVTAAAQAAKQRLAFRQGRRVLRCGRGRRSADCSRLRA